MHTGQWLLVVRQHGHCLHFFLTLTHYGCCRISVTSLNKTNLVINYVTIGIPQEETHRLLHSLRLLRWAIAMGVSIRLSVCDCPIMCSNDAL